MSASQGSDLQKAGSVEDAQEVSRLQLQNRANGSSPNTSPVLLETSAKTPLRPRTRSQTGGSMKRRLTDDSPASQKTVTSRKKTKPPPKKTSSPTDTEPNEGATTTGSPTDTKDALQDMARAPSPIASTPTPTYTFLESSSSPGAADKRGPRSRASLPVPVPNLTKRSRGRRVPTQEAVVENDPREKRMYVCNVEGCGKCFHRGEHLKRHIRSIHTHEKPFKCTHPTCGKFFNRHDNLLQHLKVHRQDHEENPRPQLKPSPASPSSSPESIPALRRDVDSSISDSDISETHVTVPQVNPTFSPGPIVLNPYVSSTQFDASCESFSTNMAISSLRTELPSHSPPSSRVRDAT